MNNNNILLTGSTGFLGGHLKSALVKVGEVDTVGRSGCTYNVDLALSGPVLDKSYDLIVHSAGKAHVIPNDALEGQQFFDVNVKGTENLLHSVEKIGVFPRAFVFISSVSVYGLQVGLNISERHPLNATDPYGKSKILAEEVIKKWCVKNNVICTILRLPIILGKNAPGNLQSMIKSINHGYYFNMGGGKARKSMVLATDVANLVQPVSELGGTYNLTDGYHPTFKELSLVIASKLGKPKPTMNIPIAVAKLIGKIGDMLGKRSPIDSLKVKKITSDLTFNDDKAKQYIKWKPTPVLQGLEI